MPGFESYKSQQGIQIFPLFICNLNCYYCVNNLVPHKRTNIYTSRTGEEWATALQRLNKNVLIWWLGGEPTLWSDLAFVSNAISNPQILLTNLYSKNSVDHLRFINPKKVLLYISLHPFGNNKYDIDNVINNVQQIISMGFSLHADALKIIDIPHENIDNIINKYKNKVNIHKIEFVGKHNNIFHVHSNNYKQGIEACAQNYTKNVTCHALSIPEYCSWIGPEGNLYACYTGLASEDKNLIIGNIFENIYSDQKCIYCTGHYGQCEPCDFSEKVQI